MRLYLNTSALNRPFDDLSSARVRLEAEEVAELLAAVEAGRATLVSSDYQDFEAGQDPDQERCYRVRTLLAAARERVLLSEEVAARARELERHGLRGLDALHVASAEAGDVEALVTTDDRMIRSARRAGRRLRVRVVLPAEALVRLREEPA
jgi:predicted nucleic acid-binding protein